MDRPPLITSDGSWAQAHAHLNDLLDLLAAVVPDDGGFIPAASLEAALRKSADLREAALAAPSSAAALPAGLHGDLCRSGNAACLLRVRPGNYRTQMVLSPGAWVLARLAQLQEQQEQQPQSTAAQHPARWVPNHVARQVVLIALLMPAADEMAAGSSGAGEGSPRPSPKAGAEYSAVLSEALPTDRLLSWMAAASQVMAHSGTGQAHALFRDQLATTAASVCFLPSFEAHRGLWQQPLTDHTDRTTLVLHQLLEFVRQTAVAAQLPAERRPQQGVAHAARSASSKALDPAFKRSMDIASAEWRVGLVKAVSILDQAQLAQTGGTSEGAGAGQPAELAFSHQCSVASLLRSLCAWHSVRCLAAELRQQLQIPIQVQTRHTAGLSPAEQRQLAASLLPSMQSLAAHLSALMPSHPGSPNGGSLSITPGNHHGVLPSTNSSPADFCGHWEAVVSLLHQICKPRPRPSSAPLPRAREGDSRASGTADLADCEAMANWDAHDCGRYGGAPVVIQSMADGVEWCKAAAGALRALPVLTAAAAAWRRRAHTQRSDGTDGPPATSRNRHALPNEAGVLSNRCITLACSVAQSCLALAGVLGQSMQRGMYSQVRFDSSDQPHVSPNPELQLPEPAQNQAFQAALWELHTAACRMVCWVSGAAAQGSAGSAGSAGRAGASAQAAAVSSDVTSINGTGGAGAGALSQELGKWAPGWRKSLLTLLTASLSAARLMQQLLKGMPAANPDLRYDRFFQGMCAATWQALNLLVPPMDPADVDGADLARCLAAAVAGGPPTLALDPTLYHTLDAARQCVPQDDRVSTAVWSELLLLAESSPRWAAVLSATGLLEAAVAWMQPRLMKGDQLNVLMLTLLSFGMNSVQGVKRGATEMEAQLRKSGSLPAGTQHGQQQQQCPKVAAVLAGKTALNSVLPSDGAIHVQAHTGTGLMGWLPATVAPARQLATALLAYWQDPEPLAAARLEAAHAAATRSCAYVGCANLAAEGGPAAASGSGSRRCSGCRVVRYCSISCSHADWAAGHRKACRLLAAERQQQEEQE